MRRASVLSLILLAACGSESRGPESVDAAPPSAVAIIFERDGLPGPWWRTGATQEAFDTEHRVCLARAREAGEEARSRGHDRADATYRGFLACMEQTAWNQGLPPKPLAEAH